VRILFLCDTELNKNSGVASKIIMQVQKWEKLGHDVDILSWITLVAYDTSGRQVTPQRLARGRGIGIFLHLIVSTIKLKMILKEKNYDIVYMRYRLFFPGLKSSFGKAKQIVEINSDDIEEYRESSKLLWLYNRVFRGLFLRNVDAFVCVSRELATRFEKFDKPIKVIANGIDCERYKFSERTRNDRPNLLFIGTPGQIWHGVDKIEKMAKKFRDFDFHIIGFEGKNGPNIFYHGYRDDVYIQNIASSADIGIGTLALHRKGMNEASPLKTRQYFAHGLPVVYAYEDTDISGDLPFTLRLPNEEDNVEKNYEKIERFVKKVYRDSSLRKEARRFAENVLDMSIKERERLNFFRTVYGEQ
jgi:glycosyltransferase involved in cell wall biosynthesis